MGKGEIARYEQFLIFPQCFQKTCFPEASKGVIVWEWVIVLCDTTAIRKEVLNCIVFTEYIELINFLLHNPACKDSKERAL